MKHFALFIAFSENTDLSVTPGDFIAKKTKQNKKTNLEGESVLTEY